MAIVVNGEQITDEEVALEVERMRPQYEAAFPEEDPDKREATLAEWARENLIERVLFSQEARNDPRPVPPEHVELVLDQLRPRLDPNVDIEEVRGEVELHLRMRRLLEELCSDLGEPTDADVEAYYSEHREEFMAPEMVRAAHIVKHVSFDVDPEGAKNALAQVRQQLLEGADFTEMVRKHSDCPENDGDLGFFPRGQMVEEFEDRVFSLPVGEVSEVFPTRFGFHIAKVLDRRPPQPYALEEVRDAVADRLRTRRRNERIEQHANELKAKATIETEGA